MYNLYFYSGAVMKHKQCITQNWRGYTFASSPKKARNNLTYRFKLEHGMTRNSKVYLPGVIKLVENRKIDDGEQLSFL